MLNITQRKEPPLTTVISTSGRPTRPVSYSTEFLRKLLKLENYYNLVCQNDHLFNVNKHFILSYSTTSAYSHPWTAVRPCITDSCFGPINLLYVLMPILRPVLNYSHNVTVWKVTVIQASYYIYIYIYITDREAMLFIY